MPYDQFTWSVEIIIDDDRPKLVVDKKYELQAHESCVLCSRKFSKGEKIEVVLPFEIDLSSITPQHGPWGNGRLSCRWIEETALTIREFHNGKTLLKQER